MPEFEEEEELLEEEEEGQAAQKFRKLPMPEIFW